MRLLNSFRYAFRGIIYCINNERNMRIHTVAALYVFAFSFFFHLSSAEYGVLLLTFAIVMMGELFNTAAEDLSDITVTGFSPVIRGVKDMASGAVLVGAFFAVGVAVCLFRSPESFVAIRDYFVQRPAMLAALAATGVLSTVYVVLGPLGIRDRFRKRKARRERKKSK